MLTNLHIFMTQNRFVYAWHVLRGRTLIYRARFEAPVVFATPLTDNTIVAECHFVQSKQ